MHRYLDPLPGRQADHLVVLLPPAQASLNDLVAEGFIAEVRRRSLAVDVLLADVCYQQVMAHTAAAELQRQVIQPALGQGYRSVWLAGISLGAFNVLHCAAAFPGEVAGLCLLAPYPGTGDVLREIEAAGGPARWASQGQHSGAFERIWWSWLYRQASQADRLPVWVGLAQGDRFIRGQRMLASLLPPAQVDEIEGDHSWPYWRLLWQRWLERGWLPVLPEAG